MTSPSVLEQQQLLPIDSAHRADFDNFIAGSNQGIIDACQRFIEKPNGRGILICADAGLGKTHLLLAFRRQLERQNLVPVYLDAAELESAKQDYLQADWILVDNLQSIVGTPRAEQALMECFEALLQPKLICSGNRSPQALCFRLPDLASRLDLLTLYSLNPPGEKALLAMLSERAASKGINLSSKVADYLVSRLQRTPGVLIAVYDEIERIVLEEHRQLSLHLVSGLVNRKLSCQRSST